MPPIMSLLPSLGSYNTTQSNPPLDPTVPAFSSTANQRKKKATTQQPKSVSDAEIALLKQELIIAKTKMIQLETSNKDLERKTKVLADTIKLYESDENKMLRNKYFGVSSPSTPLSGSPASHSPPGCPGPSSSSLQPQTVDRLINYFLDIIEAKYVKNLPVSTQGTSSSTTASAGDSLSSSTPSPSQAPETSSLSSTPGGVSPEQIFSGSSTSTSTASGVLPKSPEPAIPPTDSPINPQSKSQEDVNASTVEIVNINENLSQTTSDHNTTNNTIDEFMDVANDNEDQEHLNSLVPTIQ